MPTLIDKIVNKFQEENMGIVQEASKNLLQVLQDAANKLDLNPVQSRMVATAVVMGIIGGLCDVEMPRATAALIKIMRDFLDVLEVQPNAPEPPEGETIH